MKLMMDLRVALTAGALLTMVSFPLAAEAAGGVRFSYEKVELEGTPEWVLLPRAESSLDGKPNAASIKKAFGILRKSKGATYGKTTISVSGNPPRAKVTVNIDKAVARYALIIMAETVYTVSEMGVDEVSFPGYATGPMGREDVPFAAYILTVPLWKAVGRFDSDFVQVRMPDGSLTPSPEIAKRWKANDAGLRKQVYSYLDAPDSFTITTVAKLLPTLKIPYANEVIPLLESKSDGVQKTALDVLEGERNDNDVLDAVVKLMEREKGSALARSAAEFLGKAKSSKYSVQRRYFLLQHGENTEKVAAAKALAKSKDDRTKDVLAGALTDKNEQVAGAAAEALGALGADAEQMKALENDKIAASVRLDLARELGQDRDAGASIAGLTYLAENGPDFEAVAAIEKLGAKKSDAARKAVEGFLGSSKEYLRLAAADALVGMGDPSSLDAIAKAVKAGKNADAFEAAGYEIMKKQSLSVVLDKTKDRNALIQRMAFLAAGERAQKEGGGARAFKTLEQGTSSRDELIRGAAARAIGTFGNKEAAAVLKKLVSDRSANVRADVALGIGYLPEGEMADQLAKYLEDKSPKVQAAAITAMAQRNEAFKWDAIKALASSNDSELRAAALAGLAKLVSREDAQGVREVVSMLSGAVTDKSMEVQLTAIEQLGTFGNDKAVTSIALQLGSDEEKLRIAAVRALADTGNKSATELITNTLNDPSRNVRHAAILALKQLKDPSAKSALQARAEKEDDDELKKLIQSTVKSL